MTKHTKLFPSRRGRIISTSVMHGLPNAVRRRCLPAATCELLARRGRQSVRPRARRVSAVPTRRANGVGANV